MSPFLRQFGIQKDSWIPLACGVCLHVADPQRNEEWKDEHNVSSDRRLLKECDCWKETKKAVPAPFKCFPMNLGGISVGFRKIREASDIYRGGRIAKSSEQSKPGSSVNLEELESDSTDESLGVLKLAVLFGHLNYLTKSRSCTQIGEISKQSFYGLSPPLEGKHCRRFCRFLNFDSQSSVSPVLWQNRGI